MSKKKNLTGFIICFVITLLLMLAFLELNKNRIVGYALTILISGFYLYAFITRLRTTKFLSKCLLYLLWVTYHSPIR